MKDKSVTIILNLSEIMFIAGVLESLSEIDKMPDKDQFYMSYLHYRILTQLPKDEKNEPK